MVTNKFYVAFLKLKLRWIWIIVLPFFGLLSCNSSDSPEENTLPKTIQTETNTTSISYDSLFIFSNLDTLTPKNLLYDYTTHESNLLNLSDTLKNKWVAGLLPELIFNSSLYSAYCYSIQDRFEKFTIICLFIEADDWKKMHLLTINNENAILIDEYEIGSYLGEHLDEDEEYQFYSENNIYAIRYEKNQYLVVTETNYTYNYFENKELSRDSLAISSEFIEIDINGKFKVVNK
jgi:hypothetical protein